MRAISCNLSLKLPIRRGGLAWLIVFEPPDKRLIGAMEKTGEGQAAERSGAVQKED
jgi:hypothetical protein